MLPPERTTVPVLVPSPMLRLPVPLMAPLRVSVLLALVAISLALVKLMVRVLEKLPVANKVPPAKVMLLALLPKLASAPTESVPAETVVVPV